MELKHPIKHSFMMDCIEFGNNELLISREENHPKIYIRNCEQDLMLKIAELDDISNGDYGYTDNFIHHLISEHSDALTQNISQMLPAFIFIEESLTWLDEALEHILIDFNDLLLACDQLLMHKNNTKVDYEYLQQRFIEELTCTKNSLINLDRLLFHLDLLSVDTQHYIENSSSINDFVTKFKKLYIDNEKCHEIIKHLDVFNNVNFENNLDVITLFRNDTIICSSFLKYKNDIIKPSK